MRIGSAVADGRRRTGLSHRNHRNCPSPPPPPARPGAHADASEHAGVRRAREREAGLTLAVDASTRDARCRCATSAPPTPRRPRQAARARRQGPHAARRHGRYQLRARSARSLPVHAKIPASACARAATIEYTLGDAKPLVAQVSAGSAAMRALNAAPRAPARVRASASPSSCPCACRAGRRDDAARRVHQRPLRRRRAGDRARRRRARRHRRAARPPRSTPPASMPEFVGERYVRLAAPAQPRQHLQDRSRHCCAWTSPCAPIACRASAWRWRTPQQSEGGLQPWSAFVNYAASVNDDGDGLNCSSTARVGRGNAALRSTGAVGSAVFGWRRGLSRFEYDQPTRDAPLDRRRPVRRRARSARRRPTARRLRRRARVRYRSLPGHLPAAVFLRRARKPRHGRGVSPTAR